MSKFSFRCSGRDFLQYSRSSCRERAVLSSSDVLFELQFSAYIPESILSMIILSLHSCSNTEMLRVGKLMAKSSRA